MRLICYLMILSLFCYHVVISAKNKKADRGVSLDSRSNVAAALTEEEDAIFPRDCAEVQQLQGFNVSGVYTVHVAMDNGESTPLNVYCDMDTSNGGWLVFQRRNNGSVNFSRDWTSYENGFGSLHGEFWLGNLPLHHLVKENFYIMRIDMKDHNGDTRYIQYNSFFLQGPDKNYALTLDLADGNAGDSLIVKGQPFSTIDRKNTVGQVVDHNGRFSQSNTPVNCAQKKKGGWWYQVNNCGGSNLNGVYYECGYSDKGDEKVNADGIHWEKWKGWHSSMMVTEMKIRPKDYINPLKWTFRV